MKRNIEVKARCRDLSRAEAICRRAGALHVWTRRQTDVYFAVPDGRLKLRIEQPGEATLVRYRRANVAEIRDSHYELLPVPDAEDTLRGLEARHGSCARVQKERALYMMENVRIHLDEVEGLGTFIELEAVMDGVESDTGALALLQRLLAELGVAPEDILSQSYGDMQPRQGAKPSDMASCPPAE